MADIASVSRNDLEGRRKKLRRQQRLKLLRKMWQTAAVSGFAGGLLWLAIQPMWVLKASENITVDGNQLLSVQKIQSQLPVSYPKSLWRIQPERLRQALVKQPAILRANVSRRLFPPGLIVRVEERIPVAIAQQYSESSTQPKTTGLLDRDGTLIPIDVYSQTQNFPQLRVLGNPEQYNEHWQQVYQAISQSPVAIQEINFQDPTNLIVRSELGAVHLGAIGEDIGEKIRKLGEMRNIYAEGEAKQEEVEFIDLRNPEQPLLHMKNHKNKSVSKSS